MKNVITKEKLAKMQSKLQFYAESKRSYDNKLLENNRWYESKHWDMIKTANTPDLQMPPVTSYLFSAIAARHAEVMDRYPTATVIGREEKDQSEARALQELIDFEFEVNSFRKVYSDAWWQKLKHGAAAYGVFFNPMLQNGIGDIDIRQLDLLNIFWQPGINNIQESDYLFVVNLIDIDRIEMLYPHTKGNIKSAKGNANFAYLTGSDADDMALVVDCYYKKFNSDGIRCVHMTKFCGDMLLDSSENNEATAQSGIYDHGLYPIVLDPLYPLDGTPVGIGLVDLAKSSQSYIDRLDAIISANALISGKMRFMIKDNGGVNEQELLDMGCDVIHVEGGIGEENVRQFQVKTLDPIIVEHRQNKINELKEIIGTNSVDRMLEKNVTGYNAIATAVEAGARDTRDIIGDSFDVYKNIITMAIELIRQFFDENRTVRIFTDNGYIYKHYNNSGIKALLAGDTDGVARYRTPQFDVEVEANVDNSATKATQNAIAMSLFNDGFLNKERRDEAICAINIMEFTGKERVLRALRQNTAEI